MLKTNQIRSLIFQQKKLHDNCMSGTRDHWHLIFVHVLFKSQDIYQCQHYLEPDCHLHKL